MSNNEKSNIAEIEEKILNFWNENNIFQKSLLKNKDKEDFVFFDGPPFATGLPHYGHLLPGTMKDIIPRYKTMRGYNVERRWGWDCHGLPVENLIEKELGVSNKQEIEEYGIEKFNRAARESVLRYEDEWKTTIPRTGRWIDMDRPYKSMDPEFTESVWWGFKTTYDKGLAYEGFKSMHMCPRCSTTLSNFEVNQGYKDITDISIYALFTLKDSPDTSLVAWTTTPWTLPGNVALAVGEDVEYVKIKAEDKFVIVAKERLSVIEGEHEVLETYKGSDLIGKSYIPLFDYYSSDKDLENVENGWKIYGADFVTTEDGTGIVHIAPAFGDDDYNLGQKNNMPFVQHVDMEGKFKEEVKDFPALYVKPKDDHQGTDIEIIKYLAGTGKLFSKEKIIHSYPHCWRCDTPLLNYAMSSWFIKVTDLKDRMIEENNKVNWIPESIGKSRFGNWLEGARDWSISRSRYWGAPLPIWKSESGKVEILGSYDDLRSKLNAKNTYTAMRHSESLGNTKGIVTSKIGGHGDELTEKGKEELSKKIEELKELKIDLIISSPFERTKETAQSIKEGLSLSDDDLIFESRIQELQIPEYEGKDWTVWRDKNIHERFNFIDDKNENYNKVKERVGEFMYDCEEKYEGKNILFISHGLPIQMMHAISNGLTGRSVEDMYSEETYAYKNSEFRKLNFTPWPHNEKFEFDIHRPYIDEVTWVNEDGEKMERILDVFDTWMDSGSMPFAQHHYPFENKDKVKPADFIAEGLDQTRGWFYTLLVQGVSLFDKAPFKNVAVNGLILAEDGKKMSKSLQNYPELLPTLDKYGADSLRYFLASSPAVKAEDLLFSEKGIDEVMKKIVMRLYNVVSFYEMYGGNEKAGEEFPHTNNKLDKWIVNRLYEVRKEVTKSLEKYEFDRASRPFMDFIDDLSTWYIRRSRDRFKTEDQDSKEALQTTRFVLKYISTLMAPFMPFSAEEVYQKVEGGEESVHLDVWPEEEAVEQEVLDKMEILRDVVTKALKVRIATGMKVKQPLQSVTITNIEFEGDIDLQNILSDELNVKEVLFGSELIFDTELTFELEEEGKAREFIRGVQQLRKNRGLQPSDRVVISLNVIPSFVETHKQEIIETVGADDIVNGEIKGEEKIVIGEEEISISI
jgi:isoleucyl-tRNA synthetase